MPNPTPAGGSSRRKIWRTLNRAAYRSYYAGRHAWAWARSLPLGPPPPAAPRRLRSDERPVLYVSWGRIGDAILGTGITRRLSAAFGRPVVVLGRAETRPVFADHADAFVGLDPALWSRSGAYRRQVRAELGQQFALVMTDVHYFAGAGFQLNRLIDSLDAPHKFVYEGYADREVLAPYRPWPRTATVVDALASDPGGPDRRHVWWHAEHYLRQVMTATGAEHPWNRQPRPHLALPEADCSALLAEHELDASGYVVCQPFSNNLKKDYPAESWRRVFSAFPGQRFALIGSPREAARKLRFTAPNVADLRGLTTLDQSFALLAGSKAFVGPDSGMTHAAAVLGKPTVCIAQNANLGWFFPYPAELGFDNLAVVHHPSYKACAGCFMTCEHEPIWRTYTKGALCLRSIPAAPVILAVRNALESAGAERPLVAASG